VGIASTISGHGVHLILLRPNAVKQYAFHSIHSQRGGSRAGYLSLRRPLNLAFFCDRLTL
jgi:hypothetical protein